VILLLRGERELDEAICPRKTGDCFAPAARMEIYGIYVDNTHKKKIVARLFQKKIDLINYIILERKDFDEEYFSTNSWKDYTTTTASSYFRITETTTLL